MSKQSELQARETANAPSACRGVLAKAYSGTSRTAGVKAFCLRCVGYNRTEVTNCTSWACPLHRYRPFQRAQDGSGTADFERFETRGTLEAETQGGISPQEEKHLENAIFR